MKVIVDSYAWVEYFLSSEKGVKAKKIIESEKNELITPSIVLAEVKFWSLQEKKEFQKFYEVIRADSEIIEVFSNDWLEAAEIKHVKRKTIQNIGLVDCLLIVKQQELKTKILTGDQHFKTISNTILL